MNQQFTFRGRPLNISAVEFNKSDQIRSRVKELATRAVGLHDLIQEVDLHLFRSVNVLIEIGKGAEVTQQQLDMLADSLKSVTRIGVLAKHIGTAMYAVISATTPAEQKIADAVLASFEVTTVSELREMGLIADDEIPEHLASEILMANRIRVSPKGGA